MNNRLTRFLPFLSWWPLKGANVRTDLVAGITVALVLIPQSMAYAQPAGFPAYYGLYAAFLPGIVAAMWGSSAQLHRSGRGRFAADHFRAGTACRLRLGTIYRAGDLAGADGRRWEELSTKYHQRRAGARKSFVRVVA